MYQYLSIIIMGFVGALITSIYSSWEKRQKKWSWKKKISFFLIMFILFGLVFYLIQQIDPDRRERIKQKKYDAMIECNSVYDWLAESNERFCDTLESMINTLDYQGNNLMLNSEVQQSIVEWAKKFRIRRDREIDAKLLSLSKHKDYGCDPDTIQLKRKLPPCFLRIMTPYFQLINDYNNKISSLGLDTL